jgi:hypothetical protein
MFCAHLCDMLAPISGEVRGAHGEAGQRKRVIRERTATHREALLQIYRRDAERRSFEGERAYLRIVMFRSH